MVEEPGEQDAQVIAFAHRMFELARSGATDELGVALSRGLPPDLTNDKGDTLLMLAAYHDHPATVRVLLAGGADTSRANDRGQTALTAGVFRQNEATVRALLAAGADPDDGGPSAREIAAFFRLPAMAAILDEPRDG
ncbi:ankyrin repeat domain-containing protein [Acidothermaceae bacterium B102]|nr:ankyrin repeat domain-containing protein [Acidothermaceae bacterium B102]